MNSKALFLALAGLPVLAFAQSGDFAPGEVLVKFKSGAVPFGVKLAVGGTTLNTFREINVERIRVSAMTPEKAIKVFKSDPNVVYAELNPREHLYYTPNDPKLGQQYGIDQVKARQAWDITKGNSNTIVCVIDTGLRLDHEEFAGKIAPGGYDWSDNDGDVSDDTGSGHGTHCSGIAVAGTDNGKGIASAAFNGKILMMKIFPNSFASTSTSAIIDAANKGARVISMSFGGPNNNQTRQDAINYAWNKGVILFGAAGNDGTTNKGYPAANNNVIAVAATNSSDQKAGFSTYGDWVQLAAPGEDIMSSFLDGPSSYVLESGTSMACPFAASVAALMIGRNPSITNAQVRDILFNTADNVGNFVTKGRVNAFKAVQQVIQPLPFTGTPTSASVGVVGGVPEGTQVGSYGSPAAAGATVKAVDGSVYSVQALTTSKVGSVASVEASVTIAPSVSNLLSANIVFTGRSTDGASCLIFLFNNMTQTWDQFGSGGMGSTNKSTSLSISMSSISKYVNGSNKVRILARNVAPTRGGAKSYIFAIDQLNIIGTNKPSI